MPTEPAGHWVILLAASRALACVLPYRVGNPAVASLTFGPSSLYSPGHETQLDDSGEFVVRRRDEVVTSGPGFVAVAGTGSGHDGPMHRWVRRFADR